MPSFLYNDRVKPLKNIVFSSTRQWNPPIRTPFDSVYRQIMDISSHVVDINQLLIQREYPIAIYTGDERCCIKNTCL